MPRVPQPVAGVGDPSQILPAATLAAVKWGGGSTEETRAAWTFDSPPVVGAATAPDPVVLRLASVPIGKPRIELGDELSLVVRAFKRPMVISRDDIATIVDLDVALEENDGTVFDRPVRVVTLQTAPTWINPDAMLLFKGPLQTPPIRRTFRSYLGVTRKECSTGAMVDGFNLNLADRQNALQRFRSWGLQVADDPERAMVEVAGRATDPAVIEKSVADAKRAQRRLRRLGIPWLYVIVMSGVARGLAHSGQSTGWFLDRLALLGTLTAAFGIVLAAYGARLRSQVTETSRRARRRWMAWRALPLWLIIWIILLASRLVEGAVVSDHRPVDTLSIQHGVGVLVNYLQLGWIAGGLFAIALLACLPDWKRSPGAVRTA